VEITTSKSQVVGSELSLFAHTFDRPFDRDVRVRVRIDHGDEGPVDSIDLVAKDAGSLVGGQVHEGTALLRTPGATTLTYEATALDDEEVSGYISTSFRVYGYGVPDAPGLLSFLEIARTLDSDGSKSGFIVEGMFDFARLWDP
jgi:hypothetical protein